MLVNMLQPQGGALPALTLPTKKKNENELPHTKLDVQFLLENWKAWQLVWITHSALSLSTVLHVCYQVQETWRYDVPNEPNFVFAFLYVYLGELKLI